MNTTIAVVVALGSIAALALWLFKRFYGSKADLKKLVKLQERVDEITKEMADMLARKRTYSYKRYDKLNSERMQLNRRIKRLKDILGSKRNPFGL